METKYRNHEMKKKTMRWKKKGWREIRGPKEQYSDTSASSLNVGFQLLHFGSLTHKAIPMFSNLMLCLYRTCSSATGFPSVLRPSLCSPRTCPTVFHPSPALDCLHLNNKDHASVIFVPLVHSTAPRTWYVLNKYVLPEWIASGVFLPLNLLPVVLVVKEANSQGDLT